MDQKEIAIHRLIGFAQGVQAFKVPFHNEKSRYCRIGNIYTYKNKYMCVVLGITTDNIKIAYYNKGSIIIATCLEIDLSA